MSMEVVEKTDLILAAAIRRFSYFGIHKTTLSEIAEDLGMTKQALLYYYSDKQSLVDAVKESVTNEYILALDRVLSQDTRVEEALHNTIAVKKEFVGRYFMLMSQLISDYNLNDHAIASIKNEVRDRERKMIVRLFEKGVERGELQPLDVVKTAELLLDTLLAYSNCIRDEKFHPDPQFIDAIFQKQQDLIGIFYKALKK